MGCYYTLYLNTYGYPLLFYKVYHEEGECRQLEFWLEKEQTLETYSAQLQKTWDSTKQLFGIIKELWAKEIGQGDHTLSRRQEGAPLGARPLSPGLPGGPPASILCYIITFPLEKIVGKLTRRNSAATRRNLGGSNLELRQSCSAGETSLPEGEIITIVITNAPLIGRGQSPSTYSSAPSHLKTLVHLLYPILVSKSGIGASRLLVVLITPCSWC